jgi:hypothetical protein
VENGDGAFRPTKRAVPACSATLNTGLTRRINGLRREENVRESGRRLLAVTIALQFADQLHPSQRFAAGLDQASNAERVRFRRCPADAVDDRIDLETLIDGVECGVDQADFSPQGP